MDKINVIGLGYIGLPTALMVAQSGMQVIGTDVNVGLIEKLSSGALELNEKGCIEAYNKAIESGILFTTEYVTADTYIIAVPTPYMKSTKRIDPTFVVNAMQNVLEVCEDEVILIIESTVSPGTIDRYIRPIIEKKVAITGKKIALAHAPERIIPGNMFYELKHNPRVIGVDNKTVGQTIKELYSSFCKSEIIITEIRVAEMAKVVENTYRDINIAFANELAKICKEAKMDVYEVIKIANMHPRVNILQPGPGVGGHCISVDPWFLVGDYPGLANIILTARRINDSMPEFVLQSISEVMEQNGISDIGQVGLYGLTYKENVDDVRESPTLQLLECMHKHLAKGMKVYDPYINRDVVENQYHNLDEFLKDIEIVVIMVGHNEIKDNERKLKDKKVLDTRNIFHGKNIFNCSSVV